MSKKGDSGAGQFAGYTCAGNEHSRGFIVGQFLYVGGNLCPNQGKCLDPRYDCLSVHKASSVTYVSLRYHPSDPLSGMGRI